MAAACRSNQLLVDGYNRVVGIRLATKLRWFDRGAEAARLFFPEFLGADRKPLKEPYYVCPLCIRRDPETGLYSLRAILRRAIETRELTAEHAPPACFGGRELLLTCRDCNNNAGALLDSHARKRENPADVMAGRPTKPLSVKISAGGYTLSATLQNEGSTLAMKVHKPKYQKPGAVDGFRQVTQFAAAPTDVEFSFPHDRHTKRNAQASWLRTAYLAAFSCMGYRYILSPALERVRQQIREPEVEHIDTWMITAPGEHNWTERALIEMKEPQALPGMCARIGRHMIFLPPSGDVTFYDRVKAAKDSDGPSMVVKGTTWEWPVEPSFGLPVPEPPETVAK